LRYELDATDRVTLKQDTGSMDGYVERAQYTWEDGRLLRVHAVVVESQLPRENPPVLRYNYREVRGTVIQVLRRRTVLKQRVRWQYDDAGRPVRRDDEFFPDSPVGHATCAYDAAGRPVQHDEARERGHRATTTYSYEGDGRWPRSMTVVTPHDGRPAEERTSTVTVDGDSVRVVAEPNDIDDIDERTVGYTGNCLPIFFPEVCSTTRAPAGPAATN